MHENLRNSVCSLVNFGSVVSTFAFDLSLPPLKTPQDPYTIIATQMIPISVPDA